jgi:hypothetical protein
MVSLSSSGFDPKATLARIRAKARERRQYRSNHFRDADYIKDWVRVAQWLAMCDSANRVKSKWMPSSK